ncbi:MAG: Hpt domain-containing protein [Thaumarchaeota archaeon]|nr:Hpt domain-containing protein [Nitrososphaerota archaeon]
MTDHRRNGGSGPDDRLHDLLRAMWEKNRPVALTRIAAIETAVSDLAGDPRASSSSSDARRSAEWEAHKLAGSLGTFGLHRGTEIASEIELTLARAGDLDPSEIRRISDLALQLREEVEKERDGPAPSSPAPRQGSAPSPPSSDGQGDSIKMIQDMDDNDSEPLEETSPVKTRPGKEKAFTVTLPAGTDSRGERS